MVNARDGHPRTCLWLAVALVAGLALVGCGNKGVPKEPTGAASVFNASPGAAAAGLAKNPETTTVSVKDGKLDPSDVRGQVGQGFVLVVTGDGKAHTLTIEDLVSQHQIAPSGTTLVQFTLPNKGAGTKKITLDGKDAGTFEVQTAGGSTGQ